MDGPYQLFVISFGQPLTRCYGFAFQNTTFEEAVFFLHGCLSKFLLSKVQKRIFQANLIQISWNIALVKVKLRFLAPSDGSQK